MEWNEIKVMSFIMECRYYDSNFKLRLCLN